MPLQQALPSRWSSQYIVGPSTGNTSAITRLSYIFSNNGNHFGESGKTFVGLPFPFLRFYFVNDNTGSVAVKLSRVSDTALYWGSVLGSNTSTDNSQAKSIIVPNDDVHGITIETAVLSGSTKLYIVVSGLTDSGLLPTAEVVPVQSGLLQGLSLGGGQAGTQGSPTGISP